MASRQHDSTIRKVKLHLARWPDPHGDGTLRERDAIADLRLDDQGHLTFRFRPSRPHCGCCVLDLIELRTTLEAQPKVMSVTITVEDVPDAARWSRAINGRLG